MRTNEYKYIENTILVLEYYGPVSVRMLVENVNPLPTKQGQCVLW